ncbi:phosphocholine cytidylyltransferase family protein [Psychromarinibacter sp. C21-152]|uniref:Phosphocholine cytidylyltransferase family protein n=1 Tax=Psychromarinibacter sediminicola TaxID=3033385 RepID=A0AAE3NT16_9RHOB|nr:phosphocholine cytidylyltransferase family protein [Psychromarinibacter sediminicola]MDF0600032.1 phosphocholine cytidylyltransferase family protein [Psychromarinibacter sediminicola]
MNDTTAIILAAGLGVRMGPRGKLYPKGLIEMGGETMAAQSLATLRAFGIGRVRIVTGHLAEQYREAFGAERDVELIHNPLYDSTGSLQTLATALDGLDGDVVILESDLVYAPEALEAALAPGNRLVTSGPTGAGDEVYVWAGDEGHLQEISKIADARPEPHLGELVGITKLEAAAVPEMRRAVEDVLADVPAEHYEPGLVELGRRVPVPCIRLDDLPWAEVDDEAMLARAERVVFPRIAAARAAHPRMPAAATAGQG